LTVKDRHSHKAVSVLFDKKLATNPLLLYDGYGCVCTAFIDDMAVWK